MRKRHDELSVDGELIRSLFPFYLLVTADDSLTLVSAGSAVSKCLPEDALGKQLHSQFTCKRPALQSLTAKSIADKANTLFVLEHVDSGISLRGQFVRNSEHTLLFLGSLLISAADSLQSSGFTLKDFAPFDNAPEILILHKFREMQLGDLSRKQIELTETIKSRDSYNEQAHTDELTLIANRRGFVEQCNARLAEVGDGRRLAMLLLDLDGFKSINDTHGHDAGDTVLINIADRLRSLVSGYGIAGRLGGDEFAVLIEVQCDVSVESLIQNLQQSLTATINYQCNLLRVGLSVGVAVPEPGERMETLLHKADLAMYAGRGKRRGQVTWFSDALQQAFDYRQLVTDALPDAIANRAFTPHYQPIVHLAESGNPCFEVLARWSHPTLGPIPPPVFVESAQVSGIMAQLDALMLQQSCEQLRQWNRKGWLRSLHVNLSASSLTDELPDVIRSYLQEYQLAPEQLVFELTETSLVSDSDKTRDIMERLVAQRINLELDDFGTGYSALTHLLDFPVTGIKIDRSYVWAASEEAHARQLLRALIEFATAMGLSTVGEGIETQEQLDMLCAMGCRYGQGYLLGRPLAAEHYDGAQSNERFAA